MGDREMLHDKRVRVLLLQLLVVGKVAEDLALCGGLDIAVRGEVVGHEHYAVRVEYLRQAGTMELVNGDGRGDVVRQDEVDVDVDQVARAHPLHARVRGQYLLYDRHSHS